METLELKVNNYPEYKVIIKTPSLNLKNLRAFSTPIFKNNLYIPTQLKLINILVNTNSSK